MATPKVFVSHSHKDNAFTERLVADLRQAGADAWMDKTDLGAGDFQDRISRALARCEWFLLVLTRDALASAWVQQEVNAANRLKHQGQIKDLIFLQAGPLEHRELPALWGVFNIFDAKEYDVAYRHVLTAVGLQPEILPDSKQVDSSGWSDYSDTRHNRPATPSSLVPQTSDNAVLSEPEILPGSEQGDPAWGDFFDTLFNRRSNTSSTGTATREFGQGRGEDIEQPVEITFREAYTGTTRVYNVQEPEACHNCKGTGKIGLQACPNCSETGVVPRHRKLEVRIPPGVETGSKVKVAGFGQFGQNGGPRGDILLVVTVKPDPAFERRGDDLTVDVQVPLDVLVSGGDTLVSTPDDKRHLIRIPPGTQDGTLLRASGKGMPRKNGQGAGDYFARIRVQAQPKTSPKPG
jgi:curved DNA-binding protein CbpA